MSLRHTRFAIHKAQKIAGVLLLVFTLQALWLVSHLPMDLAETRAALAGQALWSAHPLSRVDSPLIPGDSILALRCAGLLPSIARHLPWGRKEFAIYAAPNRWLVRLPFVIFGAWLGGALWWVARRIFGNLGGYIALALYCFSPPMLLASSTAGPAILAAWGLFGLVFTGIGVAHTLYAPPRLWRPRIVLLGVAIGATAAASLAAAVAGLIFAVTFMMYLAPRRRLAALGILATSCAIGSVVFLLCFGFNMRDLGAAGITPNVEYLRVTPHRLENLAHIPGGLLAIAVFLSSLIVFLFWRRTRYFGNIAPGLVALLLPWWPGRFSGASSPLWAVPFALVFVGGIYSDLLEPAFAGGRFYRLVAASAWILLGASAALSLSLVLQT
jgi:hypothetical protein